MALLEMQPGNAIFSIKAGAIENSHRPVIIDPLARGTTHRRLRNGPGDELSGMPLLADLIQQRCFWLLYEQVDQSPIAL